MTYHGIFYDKPSKIILCIIGNQSIEILKELFNKLQGSQQLDKRISGRLKLMHFISKFYHT